MQQKEEVVPSIMGPLDLGGVGAGSSVGSIPGRRGSRRETLGAAEQRRVGEVPCAPVFLLYGALDTGCRGAGPSLALKSQGIQQKKR